LFVLPGEEFGLAVLLGLWETLKFVDLLVFWIFLIPAIWVICKIAESSNDNASIVFGTIFIAAAVFMAVGEFLQDG